MSARDDVIPADFLEHLRKTIKGFASEEPSHQMALARMAWNASTKRRRHHEFAGYASFRHQDLDRQFGRRRFLEVNRRLGFFDVTANWSKTDSYTKGYRLAEHVRKSRDTYLAKEWKTATALLYGDGRALKTLPAAVAAKGMDGITTTAWRHAKTLNKARVDIQSLTKLRHYLVGLRANQKHGRVPTDLFMPIPSVERLTWLIEATSQVLRLSKIDIVGQGYVMHRYVQARSGRLYAKGINLQTAPTIVKQAALAGMWEYDFANCHYAILAQMATRAGYSCDAIERYLANKRSTRREIALAAGITDDQAKTCLLAILYGARASEWHDNAIPIAIGPERASALYRVSTFHALMNDIQGARRAILESAPRTPNGRLLNAFGKAISSKAKAEARLAHLIQGVEAKALKAAIDLYPNNIVLIQHDGFAASIRLDQKAIEGAVLEATGFHLVVEEARIQLDPAVTFLKSQNPK